MVLVPTSVRVGLYVHVSTDEQAREGLSLAVQEQQCRDRALPDG